MRYTEKDHTFVICAYKENPYLENTVSTLLKQSVKSRIMLSTSTPNEHIKNICDKYNIPFVINPTPHLAGDDWNYGYDHADTKLVTLVHQDDLYSKDFLKETLYALNRAQNPLLSFTDYYELKQGKKESRNLLLNIKRVMNYPLSKKMLQSSKWLRKRLLGMGDAICCPSVTFVKEQLGDTIFDTKYKNSCDYKTWVDLADRDGAFVYIPRKLLAHRIYAESATTLNLSENIRQKEDLEILATLWPRPIAYAINKIYALSEKSNKV